MLNSSVDKSLCLKNKTKQGLISKYCGSECVVYICVHMYLWGQRWTRDAFCFETGSFTELRQPGEQAPGIPRFCHPVLISVFLYGCWESTLRYHTCMAALLHTKLSPQLCIFLKDLLFKSFCIKIYDGYRCLVCLSYFIFLKISYNFCTAITSSVSKFFLYCLPVGFYFFWPSVLPVMSVQCVITVKDYTTFHDEKKFSFFSISIMLAAF